MKLQKINDTFKCDECQKSFVGKDVVLKPAHQNMSIPFCTMMFVAENGTIVGRSSAQDGDQTMHCPHCGQLHLFGFDKA